MILKAMIGVAVASLLAVSGFALSPTASSCCTPGAECCELGLPCCAAVNVSAQVESCCASGGDCCELGAACCAAK